MTRNLIMKTVAKILTARLNTNTWRCHSVVVWEITTCRLIVHLLQAFRLIFSPPSSDSKQSTKVFRFSRWLLIVWRSSLRFPRRVINVFRRFGLIASVFRVTESVHLHIPYCWPFNVPFSDTHSHLSNAFPTFLPIPKFTGYISSFFPI